MYVKHSALTFGLIRHVPILILVRRGDVSHIDNGTLHLSLQARWGLISIYLSIYLSSYAYTYIVQEHIYIYKYARVYLICASILSGSVGSGKSSILAALLGEMVAHGDSSFDLGGRIAFAAQSPFIASDTVHIYVCLYMYIYMYIFVYLYIVYICLYINMYLYICIYLYLYTYTHTHTYVYKASIQSQNRINPKYCSTINR